MLDPYLGPCKCPVCFYEIDGHQHLSGDGRVPKPGDRTLCGCCGSFNIFTEGLQLRRPTPDEMIDIINEPSNVKVLAAWAEIQLRWLETGRIPPSKRRRTGDG